MPLGEVEQSTTGIRRIGGAGRIVRVDDDQCTGRGGDEPLEMIQIRHPLRGWIEAIEIGAGANPGQHRRVQRIGRHRDQDVGAFVDQRADGELDAFRGSGGDEDAVRRHEKSTRCVFACDGFARRRNSR